MSCDISDPPFWIEEGSRAGMTNISSSLLIPAIEFQGVPLNRAISQVMTDDMQSRGGNMPFTTATHDRELMPTPR